VLVQLASYLASGRHDAIIVVNLSRISRDPAEVLAFAVHCGRCGGTLEAVEEGRVDEARIAVLYASTGWSRPDALISFSVGETAEDFA